jgi:hypothetical protein
VPEVVDHHAADAADEERHRAHSDDQADEKRTG